MLCLNFDWKATPVSASYVAFLAFITFLITAQSCEMSDFCVCKGFYNLEDCSVLPESIKHISDEVKGEAASSVSFLLHRA